MYPGIGAAAAAIVVAAFAARPLRDRGAEWWYAYRFPRSSGEEKWRIADKLAASGTRGRRLVEGWYLERLGDLDLGERLRAVQGLAAFGAAGVPGLAARPRRARRLPRGRRARPARRPAMKPGARPTSGSPRSPSRGPEAESALPALVEALDDDSNLVRTSAAKALASIRGEPSHY
jgi:hypothetical protein